MHMYVTSALQKTDMKAVALQMALDIMHEKEQRDLVTGLKSRIVAANEPSAMFFTIMKKTSSRTFYWLKAHTSRLSLVIISSLSQFHVYIWWVNACSA